MVVLFFALWLIFNGRVTVEIVVLGLILSCAVYLFGVKFMGFSPKKELRYLRLMPRAIRYAAILLWEILKANFAVIRIILTPGREPSPLLCHYQRTVCLRHHRQLFLPDRCQRHFQRNPAGHAGRDSQFGRYPADQYCCRR